MKKNHPLSGDARQKLDTPLKEQEEKPFVMPRVTVEEALRQYDELEREHEDESSIESDEDQRG